MVFPLFIDFKLDPMERLLLVNFEGDPDSLYKGFEPQYVNDSVNGTGYLVIGFRRDGNLHTPNSPCVFCTRLYQSFAIG